MLDAAQAVVLAKGAGSLTLDAVAKQAGASKGGVMYNFPSKQALLAALGTRMIEHNQSRHAEILASLPATPGRELKAYVSNSTRKIDDDDQISGALMAVLHGAPSLIQAATGYFDARFARLTAKLPFEQAALVYLATEGLWLLEVLQISPLNTPQRARMVRHLLQLSEPATAAAAVSPQSRNKTVARRRSPKTLPPRTRA